ncbi:MAG: hypothetical protein QS721_11045 [Candidatus Endonucleobacter sp. (ex Gigantidas childressi)]|nr:hypothetical protein [Candidatus Endonucleobacter sp. (ex Gigantidas childressi)]
MRLRSYVCTIAGLCLIFFHSICVAHPVATKDTTDDTDQSVPMEYIGAHFVSDEVINIALETSQNNMLLVDFKTADIEAIIGTAREESKEGDVCKVTQLLTYEGELIFKVEISGREPLSDQQDQYFIAEFQINNSTSVRELYTHAVTRKDHDPEESEEDEIIFIDGEDEIVIIDNQPQRSTNEVRRLCRQMCSYNNVDTSTARKTLGSPTIQDRPLAVVCEKDESKSDDEPCTALSDPDRDQSEASNPTGVVLSNDELNAVTKGNEEDSSEASNLRVDEESSSDHYVEVSSLSGEEAENMDSDKETGLLPPKPMTSDTGSEPADNVKGMADRVAKLSKRHSTRSSRNSSRESSVATSSEKDGQNTLVVSEEGEEPPKKPRKLRKT